MSEVSEATLNVKLVDFGFCFRKEDIPSIKDEFFGTLTYLAPEMLKSNHISEKLDIWALGITMYEMISKSYPHDKIGNN